MASRVTVGALAALVSLALWTGGPRGWADLPPRFDARTMIPVSEIKPGMKGVGKTVFKGVEISEFPVEIVGVVPKYNLGGDLVLVRVTGGPLCTRECGVVGGMSGSPILVDGRLVGAIAYTWPFEKEPIGGVTPIESMLNAYVEETAPKGDQTAAREQEPVLLHGRRLTAARIAGPGETRPFADANTINLAPVGVVSCSGYSRQALANFAEFSAPLGFETVAGPGTMDTPVKAELEPGAAVSLELQRGDFSASIIGTVTYRDGDRILAFGHPFMQLGSVDLPIATAYIHEFVPSYQRTDKIGSAMEVVGSLREDGAWSVGALVGPSAPMVPVEVTVADEGTGRRRVYHTEVAREKTLTQSLVSMSIANSIEAGFRPAGEGTARVRYVVEGERGAKVTRENTYWDSGSVAAACTQEVASTIYVLRRNPFEPQEPSRVRMEVSLSDANTAAAIEEVYTEQTVAKAGEKLTVHVVLRPWDGTPFEKVVELEMPEDLEKGTLRLGVCGGELAYTMRGRLGLLQPDFHDLPSIIADIEKTELNNQLFVAAALPNTALGVAQYLLHRLPSSMADIMENARTTDVTSGREEASTLINCEHIILGQEMLSLSTEDKSGVRAATPAPTPSGESPPGGPGGKRSANAWGGRSAPLNPLTAPPLPWAEAMVSRSWVRAAAEPTPAPSPPKPEAKPSEPGKPSEPAESAEESAEEEEGEDKGALIRELDEWRQESESDFKGGEAKGIAIRSDGALFVAEKEESSLQTEERRSVWAVAAEADGPPYYGTGKDGRVYRLPTGSATPELVCSTGQLAVHALALSGGQLYAGTIPQGKLFRVDPAQPDSASVAADLPDDYIWALLPDGGGGVFAGTGPHGRLYQVSAQGEARVLAKLPAEHVLCLARLGDDLLAGSAEGGVVFRVRPDGSFEALYDSDQPAITGVAVTASGGVYACTSGKGRVVRITPGQRQVTVVELGDKPATAMVALGETVYVATTDDGKLIAVLSPERSAVAAQVKSADLSCLVAAGGRLLTGAANPGRLTVFNTAAAGSGEFLSAVLDAKRIARWGSVLWNGEPAEGSTVEVRVRVGETADPEDGTWGSWSYPFPPTVASRIVAPAARFFQYRVSMSRAAGGPSPLLQSLVLRYLPGNQQPTVELEDPLGGEAISGKHEITWDGEDPDEDTLRYAVYVRKDGAADWQLLKDGLEDKTYEWNTKEKVEEGLYSVRVVASDALSNPAEPLSKEGLAYPVIVDNTPPSLWQDGSPQVGEDRTAVIKGQATDALSQIVSVEYRVGSKGEWQTGRPADGLFDAKEESFEIHTVALEPGQRTLTVRLRDEAGNKKDTAVSVVIPKDKKDETAPEAEKPAAPDQPPDKKPEGGG